MSRWHNKHYKNFDHQYKYHERRLAGQLAEEISERCWYADGWIIDQGGVVPGPSVDDLLWAISGFVWIYVPPLGKIYAHLYTRAKLQRALTAYRTAVLWDGDSAEGEDGSDAEESAELVALDKLERELVYQEAWRKFYEETQW